MLVFREGSPIWLTAAGFLGVYLYQRRSGEFLSTRGGVRMGWLTGLLTFLVCSLPVAVAYTQTVTEPSYIALVRQVWTNLSVPAAMQEQMIALMRTPLGIASQVFAHMVVFFAVVTLFPLLGGAVAGKLLGRKSG